MGLGPRIDLRVSQQLVMTQQLQQAIKLLALSNLEIEAVIAEELAKNPLLEARPGEGAPGEAVIVRQDSEFGDEASDPTGSGTFARQSASMGITIAWLSISSNGIGRSRPSGSAPSMNARTASSMR